MERVLQLAGVSAALALPPPARRRPAAVLLGHGAGSDFREALLTAVCAGLTDRGYITCRFNFPYREQGRRLPDRAPVLEACVRDVAAELRRVCDPPPRWLVAGGKSMGGRIASQAVARGLLACRGLLLLGYPLHPAGRVDHLRTAHLAQVAVPTLFISGTRDALARRDLLERTVAGLGARATLHLVAEGDHSLHVPKRTGRAPEDVMREVVDVATTWLGRLR